MFSDSQLTILLSLLFIHSISSAVFSNAVLEVEPKARRRVVLLMLLWSLPVVGAALVYRLLDLHWFSSEEGSSRTGGVTFNFLEIDAIFNPGSKHVLEEQQREKMEIRKQGKEK